jgi:hypothetical protein
MVMERKGNGVLGIAEDEGRRKEEWGKQWRIPQEEILGSYIRKYYFSFLFFFMTKYYFS